MASSLPEAMDTQEHFADPKAEIDHWKKVAQTKDQEIIELKSQLDKFQALFQFSGIASGSGALTIPSNAAVSAKKRTRTRLFGISAEPGPADVDVTDKAIEQPQTFPKDDATRSLLVSAIQSNDFMKHLDSNQITALTACMYPVTFQAGHTVIQEGEPGNVLYIIQSGFLVVFNETVSGRKLGKGALFGELALLYNCTRTASVRVMTVEEQTAEGLTDPLLEARLWALERAAFQSAMVESGLQQRSRLTEFLRSVKLFSEWSEDLLSKVADVIEKRDYNPGDYIVRQGARGDTFFVIQEGDVRVTKNKNGGEEFIRKLGRGDFFGEKALTASATRSPSGQSGSGGERIGQSGSGGERIGQSGSGGERMGDLRTANVIAEDNGGSKRGVSCLVIDRDTFNQLISVRVTPFEHQDPDREVSQTKRPSLTPFERIKLDDLQKIATLGVGGFGRVELVAWRKDKEGKSEANKSYALKIMKKRQIVETRQQTHILSEKQIMAECNNQFIVRLFATFKDKLNLYMLMEVCLGGELWTLLRDRGHFDESMTKFYVGCVCSAFDYLHQKNIIYRDLKPENMLLDNVGYIKLTDFGFAKKLLPAGRKTWTFCGTPEYVAPEIILNRGHDYAADYWSLGVLMFELLTGSPPFSGQDPMRTYNIILRGIEAIEFPRSISKDATILIKKLCKENPSERLGYMRGGIGEIRNHRWFDGFHWDGLNQRTMDAPYVPKIEGHLDAANFDQYPPEEPDLCNPDPSIDSGWDDDF